MAEPLVIEEFASVWSALEMSAQDAANMDARAHLLIDLREIVRKRGWTQAVAAKHCGISQPRVNDLLRGKVDKFSIDALVNIAGCLGWRVSMTLEAA